MKKAIVTAIVVGLLAGAVVAPAEAGKKKKKKPKRVETVYSGTYDTPAPGAPGLAWRANCGAPNTGCLLFTSGAKDKFLKIDLTDTSGQAVYAELWSGTADGFDTRAAQICGSTEEVLEISSSMSYALVLTPPDPTVCQAPATQGSITATLSNLK